VAAIDGFCLGGGLELVLACDYRIAKDQSGTRLGFPEIQLGIFPGFGGSGRSVRRMGGRRAMELMLTARTLGARSARAAGLVDEVVGPHVSLRWAARRAVSQRRKPRSPSLLDRASNLAPARLLLAKVMRKQVAGKARPEHYPAPYALIEHWRQHGGSSRRMIANEAAAVTDLALGTTSRNLRRVYFLSERMKAFGKRSDLAPIRRVHVVGAGVMGGDIAAWCAYRGLEVTLQDQTLEQLEPALERARSLFRKRSKAPHLARSAESRLIADLEGKGMAQADVVIEAIFEDAQVKRDLLRGLEPRLKDGAVLATNTSAIPLAELSGALQRPERLIGLHFFNPVARMPLVEVVRDAITDEAFVDRGAALVTAIGKFPLPVRSAPGFLVNRVLMPYLLEALRVHQEGVPKEAVDEAALAFGMPMGPIELADTVGLDICLSVARNLSGDTDAAERQRLESLVEAGKLGKKSGEGLYRWEAGKPVRERDIAQGHDLQSLAHRLIEPMLDECEACLADGVVADADLVDAGVIFGTGFAPFRGGPLHYRRGLVDSTAGVRGL
jgi:3-hydroxyacyl-CoA dehydrogenase/enoyl-CoA hydratase/3-hydroxybutyryl-CoA epimerase